MSASGCGDEELHLDDDHLRQCCEFYLEKKLIPPPAFVRLLMTRFMVKVPRRRWSNERIAWEINLRVDCMGYTAGKARREVAKMFGLTEEAATQAHKRHRGMKTPTELQRKPQDVTQRLAELRIKRVELMKAWLARGQRD
jgi:hypothetical protein